MFPTAQIHCPMGTSENSPAIHCRDNNSPMPESHRDGRRSLIMKHLLTLIVCAAVLAWALPLSACPGPDIDAGYFASGARSQMAADLKDAGNLHDLLARRGGGRGQGKGDGSGSGQCDGSESGQGNGKGYGAKDGTGTGERPRDGFLVPMLCVGTDPGRFVSILLSFPGPSCEGIFGEHLSPRLKSRERIIRGWLYVRLWRRL